MIETETLEQSNIAMKEAIEEVYKEPSKEVLENPSEDVKEEVEEEADEEVVKTEQPEKVEGKEEEKETPDEAKPEEDTDEKKNTSEIEPTEEIKIPRDMPRHFKVVLKELEDKKVVNQAVRLYKDMNVSMQRKSQELSKHKKTAEDFNSVFEKNGRSSVKDKMGLIQQYLGFEKELKTNPKEAIRRLITGTKIDVEQFLNEILYENDNTTESEKKLKSELQQIKQEYSTYKEQARTYDKSSINNEVKEFEEAKNKDGDLKYPHFQELRGEMAKLTKVEPTLTLEQLYKKAFRLDDKLFNKSLESKRKSKEKLNKAKKISKQNVKSRPSLTKPSTDREKLKADLFALWDKK